VHRAWIGRCSPIIKTPKLALFVYPDAHLEMRQGARIILKSKEDRVG
jgi:hypothetical protein